MFSGAIRTCRLVVTNDVDGSTSLATVDAAYGEEEGAKMVEISVGKDSARHPDLSRATPDPGNRAHSRYHSVLANSDWPTGALVANAAARVCDESVPGVDRELHELGADVLGQMMIPFVLWVRARCESEGIRHVEFLARDGEVPYDIANALPDDYWFGWSLGYLHCGRRAWSLAAAHVVGAEAWIDVGTEDSFSFLRHSVNEVRFAAMLERCGLTVADLPAHSPLHRVDATQAHDNRQAQQWTELLRSGDLNDLIEQRAAEPAQLVLASLRQRGLPDGPIALVDVGWRGQQAWMISALLEAATGHQPLHLHFGGDGVRPSIDSRARIERFALDDSKRPHPVDTPVVCIEMFLASGKPRLLGYRRDEGGAVVEEFEKSSSAVDTTTRRVLAAGAVQAARLMPPFSELGSLQAGNHGIEAVRRLLELFWNHPTKTETSLLSGLRFETDDAGAAIGPVILRYRPTELLGRSATPRHWRQASLVATPQPFRSMMRLYFSIRGR